MTASIPFNPFTTTNAAGLFTAVSDGWVQGVAQDDPAYRDWLVGGVLATTETLPMWGGVGIYENLNVLQIPLANDSAPVGSTVGRATTQTVGAANQLAGFSVFNQSYANPITPSSQVPLAASGGPVNFYRLGSHARIPVAVASGLISTLITGGSTLQQVSWDFVGQQLIPYQAAYGSASVQSGTYTSSTGIIALTFASAPAGTTPTVGATFSVSGLAGTGVAPLNGDWQLVSSGSSGTVLNLQGPIGLGALTITGSTGTLAAGGGALPCKVIGVQATNCKMVSYNSTTGFANWNNNGAAALIQI
jgi:hypothetical protein